jgi:hypothetical protein
VMSMESGLRLAIERGRLMQSLPVGEGVMVAVRDKGCDWYAGCGNGWASGARCCEWSS